MRKKEAIVVPEGAKRCRDCKLVRVKEEFKKGSEICNTCVKTKKTLDKRFVKGKQGQPKYKFGSKIKKRFYRKFVRRGEEPEFWYVWNSEGKYPSKVMEWIEREIAKAVRKERKNK